MQSAVFGNYNLRHEIYNSGTCQLLWTRVCIMQLLTDADYGKKCSVEIEKSIVSTVGNSVRFRYLYLNDILAVHKI